MNEFVVIATFNTSSEAVVVKAMLEDAGIPCLMREGQGPILHSFFSEDSGVKLLVNAEDEERAKEFLK